MRSWQEPNHPKHLSIRQDGGQPFWPLGADGIDGAIEIFAEYLLGQTLARLHDPAETLNPLPSDIRPKKWDKVFYYPDEPVIYHTREYSHLFPPERIALLNGVIERADEVFERLYADSEGQILIHGDLHYWNVHLYRGELYVIGFEDVMLGYPVQDIAITLSYERQCDRYSEWREAFKQGYTGLRT
jgi:Ser/Thr protein kinase RdoA (MazF antagonist)